MSLSFTARSRSTRSASWGRRSFSSSACLPLTASGDRELRSGEDAAHPFGVVPVGVEDENPLLIGGQTAHGNEYIDERANPANAGAVSAYCSAKVTAAVISTNANYLRRNARRPWYSS